MAIIVADNFQYLAQKPLDGRLKYDTVADMVAMSGSSLYDGTLAYVKATQKYYSYDSTNESDSTLGKWRELSTGATITVDSVLSDTSENPVQNKVITATLDNKVDADEIGVANGIAELDANGKVPSSQLPSYVDDIIEGYYNTTDGKFYEESTYTTEITGEAGKIYTSLDTNKAYRWGGSAFVEISESLALGETSSTAYRGDRGKEAYDHSQLTSGNPHNVTAEDIGVQYSTMPTASADNLGDVVQFVGTTGTYTNGYFYECVSDGEDPATYSWEQKNVQPGSSGGGSLTKAITAAIDVGGIDSGTSYAIGTDIEDILSDLLEPTLYPTLTAPSASITYGSSTYYAVGATVSSMTATLTLNRGSISPAYGTSGYRSGAATNYAISTSGADTEYSDSSTSSGSFTVSSLTRATKGTIVVTGTVSYAEGEQPKDSKGNDYSTPLASGSVSASKTLTFIQPYYYGVSDSSAVSDFSGLTSSVTAKGTKTFNYTTNNQYMVMAYDSSYGDLKSITDGNGFDVTGGWTKNTLTVDGFTYYVYVADSPTTDTSAPFTFKY